MFGPTFSSLILLLEASLIVPCRAWSSDLYPAQASGVINPLGKGQDPAPVKWYNASMGQDVYLFPDVDSASSVWLRVSTNLSDVQYNSSNNHTVYTFTEDIETEAPDLSQTSDGRWVMYISAVVLNYIYVIQSDTWDPLGPWSSYGRVQHNGTYIAGYDAHAINLPDGRRFLSWSTSYHAAPSISLIQLQSVNSSMPDTPLSAIIGPNEFYEFQEFPAGNYSWLGHTCCNTSNKNMFNNPVLEAPSSWIVNNKTINLGYASNQYSDATYNTLIATADISSDLLDPSSWVKSPYNPIISSNFYSDTYGPGSGGFFEGPDGDVWFAYGAFNNASGFTGGPNIRTVRAQKMGHDDQGRILRTVPVNATRSIPGDSYSDY